MASGKQQKKSGRESVRGLVSLDKDYDFMLDQVLDAAVVDNHLQVKDIIFIGQCEKERIESGSLRFMNQNAKEWLIRIYIKCGK